MTAPTARWWYSLALAGVLLAASCENKTKIKSYSIPPAGATGVSPRTIIAVQLNNSITEDDENSLDPTNFVVTGDLSDTPYAGTLTLAPFNMLAFGMTVEDFSAVQAAQVPAEGEEPPKTDAIVFLLDEGVTLKEGEIVTVHVTDKVTSHETPVRSSKLFSFKVQVGSGEGGPLLVASADAAKPATVPQQQATGAGLSGSVTARFNRAVDGAKVAGGILVRGGQSGVHSGGLTLQTETDGSGRVLEVVQRLAAGDSFLPGETVDVTFSSAIEEAGGSTSLVPYRLEFQVEAGIVNGGWTATDLAPLFDAPVALLSADFLPDLEPVELAVVDRDRLVLLSQQQTGVWSQAETVLDLTGQNDPYTVVDALAYDVSADGSPDVIVLLTSPGGSRLLVFEVGESGRFSQLGDAVDFPAAGALSMMQADLDASGKPELLVTHPSRTYVPASGQGETTTGTLTLFELQLVTPDPGSIDPGDPASLMPSLRFQPTATPLSRAGLFSRIEAADFSGDGRVDLLAESASGLTFYENVGTASTPFALRAARRLLDRAGGVLRAPAAWTAADLDGDADVDLLAWDDQGVLLYTNPFSADAGSPNIMNAPVAPEALPEERLAALGAAVARVRALDLDGDGLRDLQVVDDAGGVSLYLRNPGAVASFRKVDASLAGAGRLIATADVTGDSGLDLAVVVEDAAGGLSRITLLGSMDVEPPSGGIESSFEFASEASGLSDFGSEIVRVAVLGSFAQEFTGYGIALDYDESVLKYVGFEAPSIFERKASFALCPGETTQECQGYASARMSYLQGTRGAPVSGILLGTFLFEKPEVTKAVETPIEFTSFTGPGDVELGNTVSLTEGSASYDLAVQIDVPSVTIRVEPPAPPELTVECTVNERSDDTLSGRVTWSSPAGVVFASYEVVVGDAPARVFPSTASGFEFTTQEVGVIPVTVTARAGDGVLTSASCEVIGIHRPVVTCEAVTSSENRVSWTMDHAVDRFVVYRNGIRLSQTSDDSVTQFTDLSPSDVGADDYSVAGVVQDIEGPRASCAGGPVGDPDTGTTLPPNLTMARLEVRDLPSDPNRLVLRWKNQEGYDTITVTLRREGEGSPVLSEDLPGTQTSYTYEGNLPEGGVVPGRYVFSVVATLKGRPSEAAVSGTIDVPVPPLGVSLACSVDASGSAVATWDEIWKGYSSLELVVEHTVDGVLQPGTQRIPLSLETTRHVVEGLQPLGTYALQIEAAYDETLPDPLLPDPSALRSRCELNFAPVVSVGDVEAGIGLSGIEIPITAETLGVVQGFSFELEYPSFLEVDPVSGLRVGAEGVSGVVDFRIEDGATPETRRAVVAVQGVSISPDADGDGTADGKAVLATLVGSLPADFTLAGERDLSFQGAATLRFAEGAGEIQVDTRDGKLLVRKRFVAIDEAAITAGSQDMVQLSVKATFDAPPAAPNYRLNALQLHIQWDPDLLDLMPVTEADQQDTAVAGVGTMFLPTADSYETARVHGDLRVSWLGFDFKDPTKPVFLYPGVGLKLLNMKFRSKVPGGAPATFARVEFVSDPEDELPTALFPEVDVPSEPDLESFFSGGVRILSGATPFSLQGISPARGALSGGAEASILGSGLVTSGTTLDDITVRFLVPSGGGSPRAIVVDTILEADPVHILIRVPPSGIPDPTNLSTLVDLEVTTPAGTAVLSQAYSYDFPQVLSADLSSVHASGGELLVLEGAGLPITSTVRFRVPGLADPVGGDVTGVEPDGTRIYVVTPNLAGHEDKHVTVEVEVPGFETLILPQTLLVLKDSGTGGMQVDSMDPASATICGGTVITISGEGFLPGLSVRFGQFEAADVQVVDGRTVNVTTPPVPEGSGTVTVHLTAADASELEVPDGFTFSHPAPSFIRGDANGDGSVSVADVSELAAIVLAKSGVILPANLDAADTNDDGIINGGDVTFLMNYLFASGEAPPAPLDGPGYDPTPDGITSCSSGP